MRDDTATNTLVAVNGPSHQRSHRRIVRAAMPVDRRVALAARSITATMLATSPPHRGIRDALKGEPTAACFDAGTPLARSKG
jgi:hypothetical protein